MSTNADSDPLGGNLRTVANIEMFAPFPGVENGNDKRLSIFLDSGQVLGGSEDFEVGDIRTSLGVGFHWFSPVGPISLTYAQPLNDESGDDVKKVQFTLGSLAR
jgi:outer membrane protein insertion porin family